VLSPDGPNFEQDCTRCRHDPELRRRWGCDGPAPEPVLYVSPCPACRGRRQDCSECKGRNAAPVWRCPNVLVGRCEVAVVEAVAVFVDKGILPNPGGWSDQAAVFTEAYGHVSGEVEAWREVHRARARAAVEARGRR
jgi:hypothetical protein